YNAGMMGRRAQAVQDGLYLPLPIGDREQQNRLAAKETLPPGLAVRVAFPQGLLCPRPCDGALEDPPEADTEGQPQPQDGVRTGEHQILNAMVVANADPSLGAGVQGGLHINTKLLGGIRLPVGQPEESVQVYNRQTEALSQGAAEGRFAGAYGAPDGDAW